MDTRASLRTLGVATALALAIAAPAFAQTAVKVGTLTCTGGEGVGLVLGSKKSYECSFVGSSGARDRYSATVTKIGLDIGVTSTTTMVWAVLAAEAPRPHALAGSYVGAAADVSVGLGGGVKVLVGGTGSAITLQPVSVQGQAGVNLAAGVAEMSLR